MCSMHLSWGMFHYINRRLSSNAQVSDADKLPPFDHSMTSFTGE